MQINQEIKNIISRQGLNQDDVLTFLLSLHFNLSPPSYLNNQAFMVQIQLLDVVEPGPVWKIPLFTGQETSFEWVSTEYCALFDKAGKDKYHRESMLRMKKLFAENPEIRKDEVIRATEMYIHSVNNPTYVKFPHYFILKGSGTSKEQPILDWIDTYRLSQEQTNRGVYNRLQ